jgi:hypothetical protein
MFIKLIDNIDAIVKSVLNALPKKAESEDQIKKSIDLLVNKIDGLKNGTKSEVKARILKIKSKQKRAKQQDFIKEFLERNPRVLNDVVEAILYSQTDFTTDIQMVVRRYLKKEYDNQKLQDDIAALETEIRGVIIENVQAIKLIYSEVEIAESVDKEFNAHIKGDLSKLPLTTLIAGAATGSLIGVDSFISVVSDVIACFNNSNGFSIFINVAKLLINFLVGSGALVYLLKLLPAFGDSRINMNKYREIIDPMMKQFTNKVSFKRYFDCLDQKKYDCMERYDYKKQVLANFEASFSKYNGIRRFIDIERKYFTDATIGFQVEPIMEQAKLFLPEKKQDELKVLLQRSLLFTVQTGDLVEWFKKLESENIENEKHLEVLKEIFMPYFRTDQLEYRFFRRLCLAFRDSISKPSIEKKELTFSK